MPIHTRSGYGPTAFFSSSIWARRACISRSSCYVVSWVVGGGLWLDWFGLASSTSTLSSIGGDASRFSAILRFSVLLSSANAWGREIDEQCRDECQSRVGLLNIERGELWVGEAGCHNGSILGVMVPWRSIGGDRSPLALSLLAFTCTSAYLELHPSPFLSLRLHPPCEYIPPIAPTGSYQS